MPPSVTVCLLLCFFLHFLPSLGGQSCTFNDTTTGLFYDLSPLQNCGSDYVVGGYFVNICQDVIHGGCGPNIGVCQSQAGAGCGQISDAAVSSIGTTAYLYYYGGDLCGFNNPRKSVFQLVCNASAEDPQITYIQESPICQYNFKIVSKYACPVAVGPPRKVCPANGNNATEIVDVFVVPHSHDDVGWLLTPDQYYDYYVREVISGYVSELTKDPKKRFIQVEIAFFNRWWQDSQITDTQRNQLRALVASKQVEFVLGGWCMNDEATPTYSAIIDQLTQGHQFLLENFGEKAIPTIGWQIDPFGASSFTGTVFALAGFKAVVLDRIAYMEKFLMQDNDLMELLWQSSYSLGKSTEIFMHLLDTNYCSPYLSGFNFDSSNIVTTSNVASYADKFVSIARMKKLWSRTSNVLIPWGCDFAFSDAPVQFANMDRIIAYIQQNPLRYNVTIKYATLSEYFSAVSRQSVDWRVRAGENNDFFPYNDDDNSWWTGYFTSRPVLKKQVRQAEALSRSAESLFAIVASTKPADQYNRSFSNLDTLRMALGEAQHHDAVSGTEKQFVADQYSTDLSHGQTLVKQEAETAFETLVGLLSKTTPNLTFYDKADVIAITDKEVQALLMYNSLGWSRSEYSRVYVNRPDVVVLDADKKIVPYQTTTDYLFPAANKYILYFQSDLPPLGFNTYFVTSESYYSQNLASRFVAKPRPWSYKCDDSPSPSPSLSNTYIKVELSDATGRLSEVTTCGNSTVAHPVDQNFLMYKSYTPSVGQHSGAYIFRTDGPAEPLSNSTRPNTTFVQGDWVNEIRQSFVFSDNPTMVFAKQVIRLYTSVAQDAAIENFVEIEHLVGPLPQLGAGREFITRFTTKIDTQGNFYHDDNGFEILRRQFDGTRPNPIPGNYYPATYAAFIKDFATQLSVVMDSSHGISSLKNGELEIMLSRLLLIDDQRGVGEALRESAIANPVLRLVLGEPEEAMFGNYAHNYLLNFPVVVAGAKVASLSDWVGKYDVTFSPLIADLPRNVHLLSFKVLSKKSSTTLLIRLTHTYEKGQSSTYSVPVVVDVTKLLSPTFNIKSCRETTITANQVISEVKGCVFTLSPKQIKTLLIEYVLI